MDLFPCFPFRHGGGLLLFATDIYYLGSQVNGAGFNTSFVDGHCEWVPYPKFVTGFIAGRSILLIGLIYPSCSLWAGGFRGRRWTYGIDTSPVMWRHAARGSQ